MNDSSQQHVADLSAADKRALLGRLLRKKASAAKSVYPLSYNQQGIWFLYQLAPESMVYNVHFSARICGDVNVPALRQAFQALVDRHPSLRTTFPVHAGQPVQQVHQHHDVHFAEIDGSGWSDDELKARLVEEAYRPFDLERGPLLRATLFTSSKQERILLLVVHHIVIDFWSLAVLLNELGVLYPAARAGVPAALPALDVQYTDYVRWQADMLAGPEGDRLWAYWRKQLAGQLPVLELLTDRPRPAIQTHRGASHEFNLSDELSGELKAFARTQSVTLYVVLLAAFQVILHYHTGQDDLLVGSPVAGRSRSEFEAIVGMFTNPVILRANLSGNPTFKEFLGQVRKTVLGALEHQDFPTILLVERLRPSRDLSRSPVCQVMFVLDKPHRASAPGASSFALGQTGLRINPGGLEMESFPLERRAATLDLVLVIFEAGDSLSVSMRYNTELFDATTIIKFAGHFDTVLRHVVTQSDATLSALDEVLDAAEKRRDAAGRQASREANLLTLHTARRKVVTA